MPAMHRYRWDTAEYADAFATLLKGLSERTRLYEILRDLAARYPQGSRAADWGAGTGDLTRVLLERFGTVFAVEPSASQRAALAERCPAARVVAGTILSAELPEKVQVGVISHVFYHIADHKWGAHVIRAADHLTPDGTLVVTLNDPRAGSNRLLAHFGAPPFDLRASLAAAIERYPEFDFTFTRRPASVRTASLEDTLKVARFVLCDRDEDAYPRLPTEEEFREHVRAHLWDEARGVGGWESDVTICFVRRNLVYPVAVE